jgi:hypothetical protein
VRARHRAPVATAHRRDQLVVVELEQLLDQAADDLQMAPQPLQ